MSGGLDELDALMAQLSSPSGGSSAPPPPSGIENHARSSTAVQPRPISVAPPSSAPPPPPPAASHVATDELDALMATLNKPSPQAPPPTASYHAPPPAASTPAYSGGTRTVNVAVGAPKPATGGPMQKRELDDMINNLKDQMKNVDDGKVASKGICNYCKNSILGEMITAMGKVYHTDHFICKNCHAPLGTRAFYEVEGSPHCEKCYKASFCPICAHCAQPIADKAITALGKKWHPDHFVCCTCNGPFPNGQFFERDGKPYCERDFYGGFAPKCAQCNSSITGDCLNALGQTWHPEHFTCAYCHKAFGGDPFHEYQGKPYCEAHYNQVAGSICAGCQKPISGRVVAAMGKKFHPEHFVCAFCMSPLASNAYNENGGKCYCRGCHTKLFG